MKIATLELPVGAGLAPMAGVTDAAFRLICTEHGASWSVSEMLSAKGWIYSQGKNKNAQELLVRFPGEGIGGLQLFGREPEYVAEAAVQLQELGFAFIDLNFGCPAPKITGNGEGSAMMREPERIGEVVKAVVKATKLPVTAKIRSGWDENSINAPLVAKICEDAGCSAIAVHARTRVQQYSGHADWSIIRRVKACVSVPVLGNGDIRGGEDALRMMRETGCDGVIIGRAAQGNPWIFEEVRAAMLGQPYSAPSVTKRFDTARRHFDLEIRLHGEKRGLLEMRKHLAWYIAGLPGSARFRESLNTMISREEVDRALQTYAMKLAERELEK